MSVYFVSAFTTGISRSTVTCIGKWSRCAKGESVPTVDNCLTVCEYEITQVISITVSSGWLFYNLLQVCHLRGIVDGVVESATVAYICMYCKYMMLCKIVNHISCLILDSV